MNVRKATAGGTALSPPARRLVLAGAIVLAAAGGVFLFLASPPGR